MPKRNPLDEYKALEAREAELKREKTALRDKAARHLGDQLMRRGLHEWPAEALLRALDHISDAGAEAFTPATPKSARANGTQRGAMVVSGEGVATQ